jgi:hypothetical protein
MIRDWTNSVRDTVVFFTNHGLTRFRDDDENLVGVVDQQGILAIDARARPPSSALSPAWHRAPGLRFVGRPRAVR